jgi:hypothetical protein
MAIDTNNIDNIKELTEEQVWSVIEFARHLNNIYPGIYTPDLVSSRMRDINMNPLVASAKTDIETALKNPKNYEEQLRGYSEYFQYNSMIYQRLLSYYGNMLSFDYTYTCDNIESINDYKSSKYKADLRAVEDFMQKFDVKKEFKKVMQSLIMKDVFFGVLRTDSPNKYVIQELPMKHCTITGLSEFGYCYDFNMIWFLSNPGVHIDMYPPIFQELLNRILDMKNNGYNPASSIDERTGEYVYQVQLSQNDGFWCWKLNTQQSGRVPMFSALFPELYDTASIRTLQSNKYIISAYKLLIGIIPRFGDNKTGNVRDNLQISPEVAGKFGALVKSVLPTSSIGFGFAPFEDVKEFNFPMSDFNILADHNKNVIASSGANRQLIFSTDRANIEETRASINVDEFMMEHVYPYFNSFLDFYVNKLTKKFKFSFKFEGTEFASNRKLRLENSLKFAEKGMVLPQKMAAAVGMSPFQFEKQLAMAQASGFVDALTPIVNASQMSGKDVVSGKKNGAPRKDESELTEAGSEARAQGSNLTKSDAE